MFLERECLPLYFVHARTPLEDSCNAMASAAASAHPADIPDSIFANDGPTETGLEESDGEHPFVEPAAADAASSHPSAALSKEDTTGICDSNTSFNLRYLYCPICGRPGRTNGAIELRRSKRSGSNPAASAAVKACMLSHAAEIWASATPPEKFNQSYYEYVRDNPARGEPSSTLLYIVPRNVPGRFPGEAWMCAHEGCDFAAVWKGAARGHNCRDEHPHLKPHVPTEVGSIYPRECASTSSSDGESEESTEEGSVDPPNANETPASTKAKAPTGCGSKVRRAAVDLSKSNGLGSGNSSCGVVRSRAARSSSPDSTPEVVPPPRKRAAVSGSEDMLAPSPARRPKAVESAARKEQTTTAALSSSASTAAATSAMGGSDVCSSGKASSSTAPPVHQQYTAILHALSPVLEARCRHRFERIQVLCGCIVDALNSKCKLCSDDVPDSLPAPPNCTSTRTVTKLYEKWFRDIFASVAPRCSHKSATAQVLCDSLTSAIEDQCDDCPEDSPRELGAIQTRV